jgi:ubiquinol-cytochrome c reductase iron-sulfur subunit
MLHSSLLCLVVASLLRHLAEATTSPQREPPTLTVLQRSVVNHIRLVAGLAGFLIIVHLLAPSWLGEYFCPCHGSKFDLAGRYFSGVPAPYNLPAPPCRYRGNKVLRIGENLDGWDFSLDSIEQM